jgi:hypothetical protein
MSATHRIVHIGDLHLGPNARQADRLAALDLIIETELAKPDLALWALPGDLFHSRSSIDDRNELAPRLQRMADAAPVVLVYGNHDAPGDLELLARLKARHPITVASRPGVDYFVGGTGEIIAAAFIPYPSRAGLVGAGVASGALEQTGSQFFDMAVIGLSAGLEQIADGIVDGEPYIPIVLGHVNVAGARASSGQPQIGQEIELDQAALQRFQANAYIGLNHIHKHQQVGRAVYAGSICRLDFGEVEPKGYVEVTYLKLGDQWQHTWQFVELPVAPLYHVEGELTREGFTFVCTTGVGGDVVDTPASWHGSEVRVRYRFKKAEAGALDVARIHAEFAEAKSLKLDPVPVLEHTVRAPEIATAVTLEAKVRACCDVQGIAWTSGLAAKLAALQSQDPAVVLAGVTGSSTPSSSTPNAATNPKQPELAEATR